MKIVVHDYSGHPFQLQLSRELAKRGHHVMHQYCTSYVTGKGAIARRPDDPDIFSVEPLSMGGEFARYAPVRRVLQELRYGKALGRLVRTSRPEVIVMCNIPLLAHAVAAALLGSAGIPMVFWQQDVYSDAIGTAARRRLGRLAGAMVAWLADRVERFVARSSAQVVAISESFVDVLQRWRVPPGSVTVIPNWAALPEMPTRPRDNGWARSHDLVGRKVVLYSGTLGLKHDPHIFLEFAKALAVRDPDARVVIVSEGRGRALLQAERHRLGLQNLMLLDYQPYEILPDVLGSADVLVTVLEPDAGRYSVPSKLLNYLCAGRAVLGLIPADNEAAATLVRSAAGVLADPGDRQSAVALLLDLLASPERRSVMGAAGRRYAEATFDITAIGVRFETVLSAAIAGDRGHPRPARGLGKVNEEREYEQGHGRRGRCWRWWLYRRAPRAGPRRTGTVCPIR
jgi:colanic acid biosynthesis glycosyl transferase WcaI